MPKIKVNFYSFIILGLVTTSTPLYAEESFLDLMNLKLKKISKDVGEKINQYYGTEILPITTPVPPPPVKVNVITPVVNKTDPLIEKFSACRKFLGYKYDTNNIHDPKKFATIYLNASIDVLETSYDGKVSIEELKERNNCVKLALESGADPDSNGKEKKEDSSYFFVAPAPIVRAVRNNNLAAVKMLLDYNANPNAEDSTLGNPKPLLNAAIYAPSQEVALVLIEAGVDLSTPNLLWIAAGNAADKVVDAIIQSKQIPVNQLNKFSDYSDEEGQTALDASESRLFALMKYQKKMSLNPEISLQDKIFEANGVLYYNYPLKPQMKVKDAVDPDVYMNDLIVRQQNVSNLLKDAGWTCNEKNCGILDFSNDN